MELLLHKNSEAQKQQDHPILVRAFHQLKTENVNRYTYVVGLVIVDKPRPKGITPLRPSIDSSSNEAEISSPAWAPAIPMHEYKELSSIFNFSYAR